jgi:hypothetical protein
VRVTEFVERPIGTYIIIGIFSVTASVILFLVGDSIAKVYEYEGTLIGAGFEAGGALAGFVIVFLLSLLVIGRLNQIGAKVDRLLREYTLRTRVDSFDPTDEAIVCRYRLFDTEAGGWEEWKDVSHVRAAGGLRIYVREMKPQHIIRVRLEDAQGRVWVSDDDYAYGVSPMHLKREDTT